ncbi:MAG: hypothetical protein J0M10_09910 [Chitinophagales bacterium]|nr:hypothetical protein [Chitinophagales bacterium]
MRSSRKIATGTGLAGVILALVHVFHGLHSLSSSSGPTYIKPSDIHFEKVEFIYSDSLGHRDTLDFAEHLRKGDSLKRRQYKLERARVDTVVMGKVGGKKY